MDKDIMDVTDLGLEILHSCLLLGIVFYLYRAGKDRFQLAQAGWSAILAGFSLLLLGSVLDITDEFASLSQFVIIGDTDTQAFLEKFIGFSGGFLFLLIGLIRWIPTVQHLSEETKERQRAVDELEVRVAERTAELVQTNAALREEIAEREQAESALQEQHALLHAIIEGTTDAIVLIDTQGRYVLLNAAEAQIFGKPQEDLIGKHLTEVLPPHTARLLLEANHQVTAGGQAKTLEYTLTTAGTERVYSVVRTPYRDATGQIAGIIGISRDITERRLAEKALQESEERFRQLAETIPEVFYLTNPINDQMLYVSPRYEEVWGRSCESLYRQPQSWAESLVPEDRTPVFAALEQRHPTSGYMDVEYRIVQPSGAIRWIHDRSFPLRDATGTVYRVAGIAEDITKRKQAEERQRQLLAQIEEQRQLLNTVLSTSADYIFMHDREGRYRFASEPALRALGLEKGQIEGKTWRELDFPAEAMTGFDSDLETVFTTGLPVTKEISFPTPTGMRDLETILSPVRDTENGITAVVSTVRDITERKAYETQLHYLANYDALTGLPNRTLFQDRLQHALAHAKRTQCLLGVVFLDLDRFKMINDSLGHAAGDALLKGMAARLKTCLRDVDTVARLSGDEFVMVLESLNQANCAAAVVRKVREALDAPFLLEGQECFVTASIGISLYPRDGEDEQTLLKHADAALYEAKGRGGNDVQLYTPEIDPQALNRLVLQNDLRRALERGELQVHYQPKVSLESGRIVGAEALLRWQHPQQGTVSSAAFIPLAEKTGLIVPIGEWVLRTACAQARAWQAAGLAMESIAVNLSARQFLQPGLPDLIARVLQETGLPAWCLELEITESLLMQDVEETIATLQALKALGVTLSVDDFGTGYSSLSYLQRFPLDRLKIDQSFVRDITRDPDCAAIALAVITLAQSLKLKVTAEGVENETQLAFLKAKHCDEIQGYYFSRPLPAEAMTVLLEEKPTLPLEGKQEPWQRTLLLVDDEPHVITSLSRILQWENYRIFTACSAREALGILACHRVEMVVSDQYMPEMKGIDFLIWVRELYPDTVRILLSGRYDSEILIEAINVGSIYRFLPKPVERDQLRNVLREAFLLHEQQQRQGRTNQPASEQGQGTAFSVPGLPLPAQVDDIVH